MKSIVESNDIFCNLGNLSKKDRDLLEERLYRKQLIVSHGFSPNEYEKITKCVKKEVIE